MKTSSYNRQQGVASLLTAIVLLICITLVVLFTSKTVIMDTKITADSVRTTQATAAAQAAMEQAVAYALMGGGIDQYQNATTSPFTVTTTAGADGKVDYTSASPMNITLTSDTQTTTAQFYFDNSPNNRCDCTALNCFNSSPKDIALVVATGFSDDGTATRIISQCIGSFNTLNLDPATGGAVPSPLVGVSTVNLRGNAHIINRYTNTNIWAGDPYSLNGSSLKTFLRKPGTSLCDFTDSQILADIPSNDSLNGSVDGRPLSDYTIGASNRNTGNGPDIADNDETLGNVTFQNFFTSTLSQTITTAESSGLCYSSGNTLTPALMPGETGTPAAQPCTGGGSIPNPTSQGTTIVTDGNASIPDPLGSPDNPVILIVNGDFRITGGTIYGLVYTTGEFHMGGNATLVGSAISQTKNPPNGTGAGSPTVIYRPFAPNGNVGCGDASGGGTVPSGYNSGAYTIRGVVSGSWRDW